MKSTSLDALLPELSAANGRFAEGFNNGSMTVGLYAPVGNDPQQPHSRDEVYFVVKGSGTFVLENERESFGPGYAFFVPANATHRFEDFSDELTVWVIFYPNENGNPRGADVSG